MNDQTANSEKSRFPRDVGEFLSPRFLSVVAGLVVSRLYCTIYNYITREPFAEWNDGFWFSMRNWDGATLVYWHEDCWCNPLRSNNHNLPNTSLSHRGCCDNATIIQCSEFLDIWYRHNQNFYLYYFIQAILWVDTALTNAALLYDSKLKTFHI